MFGLAKMERRSAGRRKVQLGCWLASLEGEGLVQCHTLDFSHAGARVMANDQHGTSAMVCFLDMRHRLAYEARVAWRKAPEMGLQFLKVWRFDEAPESLRGAIATACG